MVENLALRQPLAVFKRKRSRPAVGDKNPIVVDVRHLVRNQEFSSQRVKTAVHIAAMINHHQIAATLDSGRMRALANDTDGGEADL